MEKFDNTIFDEDFHTYLNGNLIYNIYCNKKNKEECDYITKNIIIDYHFNVNKIEKNDINYKLYSDYYDNKLKHYNNNYNNEKYIPYKYTDEYFEQLKIEKEEIEYEKDKKIHYNQYFGRYKDLLYIIQYYENLFEEYNNKVFEEEEEYNIEEDNYYSDYEYYDYENDDFNDDYDEDDDFD